MQGRDWRMILLTRLDGTEVVVNTDLIVTVERTPDTMLTLVTGGRIMVRESVEEVVERAIGFRHRVYRGPGLRDWTQGEPAPALSSEIAASAMEKKV